MGWLDAGTASLAYAANGLLGSAEFQLRCGNLDDTGFATRLYANVLDCAPDAAGLDYRTTKLASGMSRTEMLLGFSESAEFRDKTYLAIANKLWTVDSEAMDVLRCYTTILDRAPDAGGLSFWTAAREGGLTNVEMANGFIASAEFQARFGALSNRHFVELMYQTALDRSADTAGLGAWTSALDARATSRGDVVRGFAYSDEMTQKLLPLVSDGIAFA